LISEAVAFRLTSYVEAEREAQIQDVKMLRILLRPGVCWTAIDHGHSFNPTLGRNGQPIGLIEMQKRKARGVRAGIPDLLFWADHKPYAIERKVEGGVLSDAQREFQEELKQAGVLVSTAWSQAELCATLKAWGLLRPYSEAA
jgi:hypothetical protein